MFYFNNILTFFNYQKQGNFYYRGIYNGLLALGLKKKKFVFKV